MPSQCSASELIRTIPDKGGVRFLLAWGWGGRDEEGGETQKARSSHEEEFHIVCAGHFLQLSAVICGYLRLSAVICGYLRLSAVICCYLRLYAVPDRAPPPPHHGAAMDLGPGGHKTCSWDLDLRLDLELASPPPTTLAPH